VNPRTLVIGIGNRFRGDDGAGLRVIDLVPDLIDSAAEVVESDGDLAELLHLWSSRRLVVIVDATSGGGAPGTIVRFDATRDSIPDVFIRHLSSHSLGLAESIEMGTVLGTLPESLVVFGIEGDDFTVGADMTEPVRSSVSEVASRIAAEVSVHNAGPEVAHA
jgi:hydrogenase maturation protease